MESIASSLSWEKSCYDAVVQLRALLEDNRFTFANIISVMKELDLGKHNEQTKRMQVPVKSPNVTQVPAKSSNTIQAPVTSLNVAQERKEGEKREEDKNLTVALYKDLATGTNRDASSSQRANKDERKENESEVQDEPMEIENDDRREDSRQFAKPTIERQISVSIHEIIVNRTAVLSPGATNEDPLIVNQSSFSQSAVNDPRFYVCTSFAASSPKATLPQREINLGSSFATSSIVLSQARTLNNSSLRSSQYHDYCLSEGEFTLPSSCSGQSTSSEKARKNARLKEAEIFRQIEGDAFDEKRFFNDVEELLEIVLTDDDDVVMSPA